MRGLLKLVFLLAPLVLARCEFPLDFEEQDELPEYGIRNNVGDEAYRLPEDLDPIHITIEITPYFEAEGNKEAFTFDGVVSLLVRVRHMDFIILCHIILYLYIYFLFFRDFVICIRRT